MRPTIAETEHDRTERLSRETARQRIVFIETDIDTAITFLRLALTELGMRHSASVNELLAKARIAHAATAKLLADVADPEQWQHLHDRHQALTEAIWEVERRKRRHEEENP